MRSPLSAAFCESVRRNTSEEHNFTFHYIENVGPGVLLPVETKKVREYFERKIGVVKVVRIFTHENASS